MGRMKGRLMDLALRRPALVGSVATLLAVGIGLAGAAPWLEWRKPPAPTTETPFTLERAFAREAPAAPPRSIPDFTLRDEAGRQVRLRDQAGKIVLVNFITTHCTTVCIQVTQELRGLQKALGGRMGREVIFLSVGLDPKRDTPQALSKFARRHGVVNFRGWAFLTGTREELDAARRALGALAMQVPTVKGPDYYDIEHTSATYLLDRQGVLRKKLPPGLLTLVGLQEIKTMLTPPA